MLRKVVKAIVVIFGVGAVVVVPPASTFQSASAQTVAPTASSLIPMTPSRILDTRAAQVGYSGGRPAAGAVVELQVAGTGGVPLVDVGAVVLNITATDAGGAGYITVWPTGQPMPGASSLNLERVGQTIPNLVVVPVGSAGKISIFSTVSTHLLADVAGWFPSNAGFNQLTPARVLDSRSAQVGYNGVKPSANATVQVQMTGRGGVPASGVGAVVLNVTATESAGAGYVTVWPTGQAQPTASSLNLDRPGQTIPNLVIVPVGSDGKISMYTNVSVHLLADVAGWFPVGTGFTPLSPTRVLDSRSSQIGYSGSRPASDAIVELQLTGRGGVPASGVGAVVLNVTATDSGGGGYITVWPTGRPQPVTSSLNLERVGQTIPNLVVVPVGAGGKVSIYTSSSVHLIADVSGWFPIGSMADPSLVIEAKVGEAALSGDIKNGTGIIAYSGPRTVSVGSFFVLPPEADRVGGFYGRVDVISGGGRYQVSEAALGDLIPSASFQFSQLDLANPASASLEYSNVSFEPLVLEPSNDVETQATGFMTFSCDGGKSFTIDTSGTGPFVRNLELDADWDWRARLKSFKLSTEVGMTLALRVQLAGKANCGGNDSLASAKFTLKGSIGPVPVWVDNVVSIGLSTSLAAEGRVDYQLRKDFGARLGVRYTNTGGFEGINEALDAAANINTIDGDGSFHGEISLPMHFESKLFGAVGVSADGVPKLTADGAFSFNNTTVKASAKVHFELPVTFKALVKLNIAFVKFEKEWPGKTIKLIDRELLNRTWEYSIPPRTPVVDSVISKPPLVSNPVPASGRAYQVQNAGGVQLFNSANSSDVKGPGPGNGASVTVVCQTWGDAVGVRNNHIWDYIRWNGAEGFIPDAYTNTAPPADNYIAGMPKCSNPAVAVKPPVTASAGTVFLATNVGAGSFLTDLPSVSAPRRTPGPAQGDRFELICQAWGDPYGVFNNHIWNKIRWNGVEGLLPDTFAATPTVADQFVPGIPRCPGGDPIVVTPIPVVAGTRPEQQGSRGANTFLNTTSISGPGPRVNPQQVVNVSCKVLDRSAASISPDGYWYRLADSPWNNQYYAAANTFMNGDPAGGPFTHNTDFAVPDCNAPVQPPVGPTTKTEQSGSTGSPTFQNPTNASGPGTRIGAMAFVEVVCKVYAPQIASVNPDGYWYKIASAPWNSAFYAPANTFWNGDVPGVRPYTHNTDFSVPNC
jgi:hypothetical protein